MTINDYKIKYPNTDLNSELTKNLKGNVTRGKTYEELYGTEKAKELRNIHSQLTTKQMENLDQRLVRKHKLWKGFGDISGDYWRTIKEAGRRFDTFDITIEYLWDLFIKQEQKCVISGLPLYFNTKVGSLSQNGFQQRTASLDRIDSTKGYVKGNVQWVDKYVNRMMTDFPKEKFLGLVKTIYEYQSLNNKTLNFQYETKKNTNRYI